MNPYAKIRFSMSKKKWSHYAKDSNNKENRGKNSKTAEKSKNSYKIAKNKKYKFWKKGLEIFTRSTFFVQKLSF